LQAAAIPLEQVIAVIVWQSLTDVAPDDLRVLAAQALPHCDIRRQFLSCRNQ
jgi:hypothetical protein